MKENLSRFLFSSFFGNTGDIIYGSIDRAYRDMMTCRKPLVPEKEKNAKEKLTLEKRLEASDTLYCAIENLLNGKVSDYGNWLEKYERLIIFPNFPSSTNILVYCPRA